MHLDDRNDGTQGTNDFENGRVDPEHWASPYPRASKRRRPPQRAARRPRQARRHNRKAERAPGNRRLAFGGRARQGAPLATSRASTNACSGSLRDKLIETSTRIRAVEPRESSISRDRRDVSPPRSSGSRWQTNASR